jgi:hypothetical protein
MIMVDSEERDLVEGRYTQQEPETADLRRVHGRYTGISEEIGPESEVVGAYVGAERDDEPPLVRSAHQRIGNYPKAEHEQHEHRADDGDGSGRDERA